MRGRRQFTCMNRTKLIAIVAIVAMVTIALRRRRSGGDDEELELDDD